MHCTSSVRVRSTLCTRAPYSSFDPFSRSDIHVDESVPYYVLSFLFSFFPLLQFAFTASLNRNTSNPRSAKFSKIMSVATRYFLSLLYIRFVLNIIIFKEREKERESK